MTNRDLDPPPRTGARRLRFDRFVLDLQRGSLVLEGNEVAPRPKTCAVLRHLVENSGRLVSKDELFAAVWPNLAVTDGVGAAHRSRAERDRPVCPKPRVLSERAVRSGNRAGRDQYRKSEGAHFSRFVLAAAYPQQGRSEDAARVVSAIRRADPTFDPQTFGSKFLNRADVEHLRDGFRKAGL